MVPTSVKGGAGVTRTRASGGGEGAAATGGGVGGRREEENSGRSRVAESADRGIAHKGLPALAGSTAGAGAATTTGASGASASKFGAAPPISIQVSAPLEDWGWAELPAWTTQGPAIAKTTQRHSFLMGYPPLSGYWGLASINCDKQSEVPRSNKRRPPRISAGSDAPSGPRFQRRGFRGRQSRPSSEAGRVSSPARLPVRGSCLKTVSAPGGIGAPVKTCASKTAGWFCRAQ